MVVIVICWLTEKNNKTVTIPTQFRLGKIRNGFDASEFREVSLKGNVYDFSAYYIAIDKSDILNIHKHLMTLNDIE